MDDYDQKYCWGLTVKAVLGFAVVMALTWLVRGADAGLLLAASG